MDSGWAVVLGAVIALAGSSLIPWLRSSIEAGRDARAAEQRVRREAVIELLAANSAVLIANGFQNEPGMLDAMQRRARAASTLLLSVDVHERDGLALLIERSIPITARPVKTGPTPRVMAFALQGTLVAFETGAVAAPGLVNEFQRRLDDAERNLRT